MIRCKELGKSFTDKKDLFKALKAAKHELIAAKKAVIKFTDPVISSGMIEPIVKGINIPKEIGFGDFVYPVINTINFLDSHKDVHLWGIWDKSAKEQNGKIYYIVDHDLALGKVISYPKDVEIMVKEMTWAELGYKHKGKTQALVYKAKLTERSNKDAFDAIKAGDEIQNSVRMQYVRVELAMNSKDADFAEEFKVWNAFASKVVNQEALNEDYFWAVHEAKIYMEGSAVLFGSNEATPVLYTEPKQADKKVLSALNDVLSLMGQKKSSVLTRLAMKMGVGLMVELFQKLMVLRYQGIQER